MENSRSYRHATEGLKRLLASAGFHRSTKGEDRPDLFQMVRFFACVSAAMLLTAWAAELWNRGAGYYTDFDPYFANGTFQLLNPLRRIHSGVLPPEGLYFFHGPLIPYFLYPFYSLHPNAEYADFLTGYIPPVLFLLSTIALFTALTRSIGTSLLLSLLLITVNLIISYHLFPGITIHQAWVKHGSLYGVRSAFPFLVAALLCVRKIALRRFGILSLSLFSAFAIGLGTEQGMACTLATAVVLSAGLCGNGPTDCRRNLISAGSFGFLAIVFLALAVAATQGSFQKAVHVFSFNYSAVPTNQFWFFGVPPALFAKSWSDLLFTQDFLFVWAFGAAVLLGWLWLRKRSEFSGDLRKWDTPVVFLLVYGTLTLVSILGISAHYYTTSFLRVCWTLLLLICWKASGRISTRTVLYRWTFLISYISFFAAISVYLPMTAPWKLPVWSEPKPSARWASYDREVIPELKQVSAPPGSTVLWSTYTSYAEAKLGIFPPSPTDYIIHSLGPKLSEKYLSDFDRAKPLFVQTLSGDEFSFESWLQGNSWPFYERVLANYEFYRRVEHGLFWRRVEHGQPKKRVLGSWKGDSRDPVWVPITDSSRFATVTIEYEIVNRFSWIPFFGKTPRYLVQFGDKDFSIPYTLPPYSKTWTLPVRDVSKELVVAPHTVSLFFPTQISIRSVSIESLPDNEGTHALFDRVTTPFYPKF